MEDVFKAQPIHKFSTFHSTSRPVTEFETAQWTFLNMNQVQNFVYQFVKIHFNIILPDFPTGLLFLVVRSNIAYALIVRWMLPPDPRFRLSRPENSR